MSATEHLSPAQFPERGTAEWKRTTQEFPGINRAPKTADQWEDLTMADPRFQ